MSMPDDDPTPEELREAEALVEALDRGRASEGLPEEALETAALLRYSADGGRLAERRQREILEEVLGASRAVAVRPRWWSALWVKSGLAVAGAVVAVAVAVMIIGPFGAGGERLALPSPPKALLDAQARAATGQTDGADLERAMQPYRVSVVQALEERYEP